MRDLSHEGAGFESDIPLTCGQPISYRWGNEDFRHGTVIWSADGRFGVENDPGTPSYTPCPGFAYRSVRIPASLPATVYVNAVRHEAELVNLAHRGLCVLMDQPVVAGALATVRVGRHLLEAATVKWADGYEKGIALARPLGVRELSAVLRNAEG
ncbi:hypothetical protein [Parerythrobacter lacustris]|uniref:PilZ domain-containing protein n=1 Tax=Parerythrobacter lacustris TaxID=2969984 RepID=A0ABT1XLD0_9SPHN|nr:hypothetical protein [Parerythrobacter lacustris]MCR2832465.1 hypothetical protein [Parerythrobacter lacustris]